MSTHASPDNREGILTRTIQEQAPRLPADSFLWASLGSMGVSLLLQLAGKKNESLFIGQWAPSFLLLELHTRLLRHLRHRH